MNVVNFLRRMGFDLLYGFGNESVLHNQKYIENYYSSTVNYNFQKLNRILEYACKHVPYYQNGAAFDSSVLESFPVITKNNIMDDEKMFKSDEFLDETLHTMCTSGSTGRPFRIEQDSVKRNFVLGEILYYSSLVGYKVGNKLVYLRNLESGTRKSKFKKFLQNEEIIYLRTYDDSTLRKIYDELNSYGEKITILGYASTLNILSSYMLEHNLFLENVTGVISGAEALNTRTRHMTESQFKCKVVSRYSNQEMGILGQDDMEDEFNLNLANYYFEILNFESDMHVEDGEVGRIVVTDLNNKANPLIRYDTGDVGSFKKGSNRTILTNLSGRKLDLLYNANDEPVSFFAFDDLFENNYSIKQYQIIQHDKNLITINLILNNGDTIDEKEIINETKKILGDACQVQICYLETVPITSSGKFKYVICNYKPK